MSDYCYYGNIIYAMTTMFLIISLLIVISLLIICIIFFYVYWYYYLVIITMGWVEIVIFMGSLSIIVDVCDYVFAFIW